MMVRGAAAIVEPRRHPALKLSLTSVRSTIDWPIYVFHGTENIDFVHKAVIGLDNVHLVNLNTADLTLPQYNELLTSVSFYETFAEYEFVLIFQTDAMLFPFSPYSIQDFCYWDFVGAPWGHWPEHILAGNGGLSLRRVSKMLEVCREFPWATGDRDAEDIYFARVPGIRYAPRYVSQRFSVETLLHDCPLGCHKPWWVLKGEEWKKLVQYAPIVETLCDLN